MSAVFSECGLYRYRLERTYLLGNQTVSIIMANPSTADEFSDDATIRRLAGFAKRLQWKKILIGNLYGWRSTDIGALHTANDPIGPTNDDHIKEIINNSDMCVVAWGGARKFPSSVSQRITTVWDLLEQSNKRVICFGTTLSGDPRHPLMVPYSCIMDDWTPNS